MAFYETQGVDDPNGLLINKKKKPILPQEPTVAPVVPPTVEKQATDIKALTTAAPVTQTNVIPQPNGQDYINQLKQAQLNQRYADLQNAYNKNISTLNSEKSAVQPLYYDKRNQEAVSSQLRAKNLAEYMASRSQTNAGVAGQTELNRNMQLQSNIGALNRDENNALTDIERRRSDLATALEQDKISSASGIEASAMQNLINQFNTDRSYNYQLGRDSIGDNRYNTEYADNRGDIAYNRTYQAGRDSVADTGKLANGQQTLAGRQADAQYQSSILAIEAQKIANQFAPQIQQGQIDATTLSNAYQGMVNANYTKEEAAKIAQILAQTAGVKLSNDAQAIANKYAPQIQQGQIDAVKLQNAYQKLVNAGYPKEQAADIAAKSASISQGWAQIDISRQNANTSSAAQAWSQNPNNPDNIYKQAQIEKIQSGVSGSAGSMTTKQVGDAKIKIAQQLYNQTGTVPTQAEIDSAFTTLYGGTKPTTTTSSNAQQLYSSADSVPASNRQQWYNDNKGEIDKYVTPAELAAFKAKYGIK